MDLMLLSQDGPVAHVACSGRISQADLPADSDPLKEVIGPEGYGGTVYLDLSRTKFIDSSGMAWLLEQHKAFEAAGGKMILHSPPPLVRQALELLRLHKILRIEAEASTKHSPSSSVEDQGHA